MGWRDRRPQPQTELAALQRRIESLEGSVRSLRQTGPTSLQLIDFQDYEDDLANVDIGEVHINWPGVHREAKRYDPAVYFHDEKWRALGSNAAVYEIKVFEDDFANIVKGRAFVWEIPEDLDGAEIMKAGGFVTTTGGDTIVQITNDIVGGSVLNGTINIPAGQRSSRYGTTPFATGGSYKVNWGDQLAINTLSAGGMGLGVWVLVVGSGVGGIILKGEKGDPGDVVNWTGGFNSGSTYSPGDAVSSGSNSYVAIQPVPAGIIPGVTAGWQTYWMLLATGISTSSFGINMAAGGYQIQPGIKGSTGRMPFGGTITEATLVSDRVGSVTVDIWKTTFAGYPPTVADSITGGAGISLSSGIKTTNTILSGWTTAFAQDDIFVFVIPTSIPNVGFANLTLKVARA